MRWVDHSRMVEKLVIPMVNLMKEKHSDLDLGGLFQLDEKKALDLVQETMLELLMEDQ